MGGGRGTGDGGGVEGRRKSGKNAIVQTTTKTLN